MRPRLFFFQGNPCAKGDEGLIGASSHERTPAESGHSNCGVFERSTSYYGFPKKKGEKIRRSGDKRSLSLFPEIPFCGGEKEA